MHTCILPCHNLCDCSSFLSSLNKLSSGISKCQFSYFWQHRTFHCCLCCCPPFCLLFCHPLLPALSSSSALLQTPQRFVLWKISLLIKCKPYDKSRCLPHAASLPPFPCRASISACDVIHRANWRTRCAYATLCLCVCECVWQSNMKYLCTCRFLSPSHSLLLSLSLTLPLRWYSMTLANCNENCHVKFT